MKYLIERGKDFKKLMIFKRRRLINVNVQKSAEHVLCSDFGLIKFFFLNPSLWSQIIIVKK